MEKYDYSFLDTIKIDDYDLILAKFDMISYYCAKNKIYTVSELLRRYDNNELVLINNKCKAQLLGFIEMIKFRYFQEKISVEEIFFVVIDPVYSSEFKYVEYISSTSIRNNKFKHTLYRLGLSTDEGLALREIIMKEKRSMTVMEAILRYKTSPKKKLRRGNVLAAEVFNKKIDILIDYYNKYLKDERYVDSYKAVELEELLKLFKDKKEEIINLVKDIKDLREKIESKKQFVSDDKREKLIKQYNYVNKK